MPRGLHLSAETYHSGPDHENGPSLDGLLHSSPSTAQSLSTNPKLILKRKPKFDNTVIIPVRVDAKGNLKPSIECSQRCTYYFHQKNDAEGVTWKTVTTRTKNFYWGEFKKYITHDGFDESVVKNAWNRRAARRYNDWISGMSKLEENPKRGVEQTSWDAWKIYWNTEEYEKKSERASNNRRRNGKGMFNHTGGSQTFEVQPQRMEGLNPDLAEFPKQTHSRKVNNELVFCNDYAAQVNAEYLEIEEQSLLELQTETESCGSSVPTELPLSNKAVLFKEAADGEKRGEVCGSGSAGMAFYSLTSGVSTSMGCSLESTVQVELRQKIKYLEEAMARVNEERDEAIALAIRKTEKRARKRMKKIMKKMMKKIRT